MKQLINNKLVEEMVVPSYATDINDRMTPVYFMQVLEEAGSQHAKSFGMSYHDLLKVNLGWIVSRLHIHFIKPLKWEEPFVFSTWHRGQEDGLFFRREATMTDLDGTPRIVATTGWLLLDFATRSMVRHSQFVSRPDTFCDEKALEEPAPKLRIPAGVQMDYVYSHHVRMSDLDHNQHVNNTRYARYALDALPQEVLREGVIKDFYINFVHEAQLNGDLDLYVGEAPAPTLEPAPASAVGASETCTEVNRVFYVEGKMQGKTSFLVKIVL